MEPDSAQVRDFIERLVESLVSGQLDDVKLNRLYTHPECKCHEYCREMLDSCNVPVAVSQSLLGMSSGHICMSPVFTELVSVAMNVHIRTLGGYCILHDMLCRQYRKLSN